MADENSDHRTNKSGKHPDKALSAAFVRTVTKAGKYTDGQGLFLKVDPSGARRWVQRIAIRGKRTEMGIGPASLVGLAEAREIALANRKLARQGGGPHVIYTAGGGGTNQVWTAIRKRVIGINIETPQFTEAAAGAASLARI